MALLIYFIIFLLIVVYVTWTWNSTEKFENTSTRIAFLIIGTLFVILLTFILFLISKIGVDYPQQEMIGEIRKIILLVFVPINGFLILPHVARIVINKQDKKASTKDLQKKVKRLFIIIIILIILECIYFKDIQTGILNYINIKQ